MTSGDKSVVTPDQVVNSIARETNVQQIEKSKRVNGDKVYKIEYISRRYQIILLRLIEKNGGNPSKPAFWEFVLSLFTDSFCLPIIKLQNFRLVLAQYKRDVEWYFSEGNLTKEGE